jgi:gluconate 5-dehydrogenase
VTLHRDELFSLDGRTAVVTGGAGFLGRTLCAALLENGARVVVLGRSDRLDEEAARWSQTYGDDRVRAIKVDMFDRPALERAAESLAAEEQPSILVNNAHEMGPGTGFNTEDGTLENADWDQWVRNFSGGVWWPALLAQKLGAGMRERGGGSIVNIASMYALVAPSPALYEGMAFANPPGYSAAKAGMVALTRYIASFWGRWGVRANAILPGPFSNTEDDGPNAVPGDDPFLDRLRARTTLGRVGEPNELAGALLFLASDASTYVTGHALVVDGGWTIT